MEKQHTLVSASHRALLRKHWWVTMARTMTKNAKRKGNKRRWQEEKQSKKNGNRQTSDEQILHITHWHMCIMNIHHTHLHHFIFIWTRIERNSEKKLRMRWKQKQASMHVRTYSHREGKR